MKQPRRGRPVAERVHAAGTPCREPRSCSAPGSAECPDRAAGSRRRRSSLRRAPSCSWSYVAGPTTCSCGPGSSSHTAPRSAGGEERERGREVEEADALVVGGGEPAGEPGALRPDPRRDGRCVRRRPECGSRSPSAQRPPGRRRARDGPMPGARRSRGMRLPGFHPCGSAIHCMRSPGVFGWCSAASVRRRRHASGRGRPLPAADVPRIAWQSPHDAVFELPRRPPRSGRGRLGGWASRSSQARKASGGWTITSNAISAWPSPQNSEHWPR